MPWSIATQTRKERPSRSTEATFSPRRSLWLVALLDDFTVTGVAENATWVHFDLPFSQQAPIDNRLLDRHGYSLALVFTSSRGGAEFAGAIGSTLLVDDCRLTF